MKRRAPERREMPLAVFFGGSRRESTAPGAASAGRAGVRISFAGRSGSASLAVRTPQRVAAWPFDAYSLAVACGGRGVSRRHLSRQPFGAPAIVRRPASGHDFGSLLRRARDLAPRPVALCTPDRIVGLARLSARRSAMAVEETPPFARDRDVAPGALAARRPRCRAFAARHIRHLPVPPHTPDASSGNAPWGQVTAAHCTTPSLLRH